MRLRAWMVAILGGTLLKFGLVLLAYYVVGPERVAQFFNPFG